MSRARRDEPFWKAKPLAKMTEAEWESLCDGCGKCCLVKLEDMDTAEIFYTGLHCKLLNPNTCQCSDYANRKTYVPECVKLTPESISGLDWLPRTCAYRLIHEGKDLFDWHHLVCGDRWEVHRRGVSAMGKVISEEDVDEEDAFDHLVDWEEPARRTRRRKPVDAAGKTKAAERRPTKPAGSKSTGAKPSGSRPATPRKRRTKAN